MLASLTTRPARTDRGHDKKKGKRGVNEGMEMGEESISAYQQKTWRTRQKQELKQAKTNQLISYYH